MDNPMHNLRLRERKHFGVVFPTGDFFFFVFTTFRVRHVSFGHLCAYISEQKEGNNYFIAANPLTETLP
jgi:hypothetical protein